MPKIIDQILHNKHLLVILAIIFCGILLMDLNYRVNEYFTLNAQKQKIETQVYGLWATREALKTELAYSRSDDAVEKWAREEGKMVKPGDVRVVPLSQGQPTVTPVPLDKPTQKAYHYWEYWWAIFFE